MSLGHRKFPWQLALKLAGCLWAIRFSSAQTVAPGQTAIPTASQRFKNIQVLKEMPADRLFPTMSFVATSLNVDCGFCHVDGPDFDKDDKKEKQIARKMMQMQLAINQTNFDNQTAVTCNTCHRGSLIPVGSPLLKTEEQAASVAMPSTNQVTAIQAIEKYIQALGGAEAIGNITSFIEKGSYSNSIMPGSIAFEAFAKAPDQRLEVLQYPGGDALTGYGHGMGWVKGRPSTPAYAMSSAAAEYFSYFADIHSAAHLDKRLAKFRLEPPERIGD